MSEQRLEKERDFYKKRCNDLGGQVFRLGEDLSRARSDTRRAATAAKLIRQAYESLTDEDEAADVAPKVLQVVLGAIHADYAVLWRREGERWIELSALGNAAQEARTLTLPPDEAFRFAYASAANPADEGTAAAVAQAIGYPYLLWAHQVDQGMALAVGRNSEDMRLRAAFEEADEEMISSALSVFCDLHRRKLAESELARANQGLRQLVEASRRFVPHDFLEVLGRQSIVDVCPGDETAERMTILFSDVRGFTTLSEAMPAGELFRFINRYLADVLVPIHARGGFVDKFIGDAIMALFRNPGAAVLASVDMFRALEAFNAKDDRTVRIGVGLHTGPLILGTLGDDTSLQCTVISDAVNLASRLEGMTKQLGCNLLISDDTLQAAELGAQVTTRCVGRFAVKGKTEPTMLHQVIDAEPADQGAAIRAAIEPFERGRDAWYTGALDEAQRHFAEALAINPHDTLIKMYLGRCWSVLAAGEHLEGWSGVLKMTSK